VFVAFSSKKYLADFYADFQQQRGSATCFETPKALQRHSKVGISNPLLSSFSKILKAIQRESLGFSFSQER
jgi:hypothetical protein